MTSFDKNEGLSPSRPRRRRLLGGLLALAALTLAATAGAAYGAHEILPQGSAIARGLRIGGAELPQTDPTAAATAAAERLLQRRVTFTWNDQPVLESTLQDLGATVDIAPIAKAAAAVGRNGDIEERIDSALRARRGLIDIPVRAFFPVEPLAEHLSRFKEERDTPPLGAKFDFDKKTATPHTPGRYIDIYDAVEALTRAVAKGEDHLPLPVREIAPRASTQAVLGIEMSKVLSRYQTTFGYLGGQVGRAQNIQRAADGMNGVVLMPGETVSFNANVGARSEDNGFAKAPEIYKGEMREGVGGGTCQVSGTLYAAAYLGGIEVVERANHSRPSGYIPMGLDATVVYPAVDLKLKNPFEFPVVIHATIDKGTLVFELLGREKPVSVDFETATVGVSEYKRKIEEVSWLREGTKKLKQRGIRGYSLRKTRVLHLADGQERVEVTTDVYPATFEIWQVPPGTDPDALPPLHGKPADDAQDNTDADGQQT